MPLDPPDSAKKACLLWLILHKGIWTNNKAAKIGKGQGLCPRCRTEEETIHHLFFHCPHNGLVLRILNSIMACINPRGVSLKQLVLGDFVGCSTPLWNCVRSEFLWFIWRSRNASIFQSDQPILTMLKQDLFFQLKASTTERKKEVHRRKDFLRKGKHACRNQEIFHQKENILYHRWDEEMEEELLSLREKDKKLTEHILEVTKVYFLVEKDEASIHPQR